ncbi:fimbrial protein [Serratia fonticola]|uniref:fimbrial protein n=1 Tax=Serratia fonticola TaxID=47917 RepID=UPI000E0E0B66|nr:fimbrial protein [Serratia fonticola]RDL19484.1 minor fimbrial subunit [Serratia fonticola]
MDMKAIFKTTALCLALGGMGISYSALAVDARIKITGTVKASPCTVDAVGGDVNVNLGEIKAHTLTAGAGSDWQSFSLDLSDCPVSTTNVTAAFTGTAADESTDLYKNEAANPAGAVQIEMVDGSSSANRRLGSGSDMTVAVDHSTNKASFPLKARAFSTNGGATPGSIEGVVQVALTYQ